MSGLDLSHLSGPDAAVAVRSYPRRFREAIHDAHADPDTVAAQLGPDGHSVLDLLVHTTNTFVLLGRALHDTLVTDQPTLHAGVVDADERHWDLPPGTTLDAALARLQDEATALADTIGSTHGDAWARTASVVGGRTVTALDLAREAVRTGADDLRAAEVLLRALRR